MASCSCVRHRFVLRFVVNSARSFSSRPSLQSNVTNPALNTNVVPKPLDPSQGIDPAVPLKPQSYANKPEGESRDASSASTQNTASLVDAKDAGPREIGKPLAVDARKVDPTTVRQVYYFDSLSFVKNLERKGFSRDQAEGLAETLTEIINSTLDHQTRHMITKSQQEITVQQLMAEIVSVKKDMVLLQKSEFSQLCTETEKMGIELSNLKNALKDEVTKLKGHVTLDINLERGRAIEAHAGNEAKLQNLHNKIDTDVANLKTVFEQYRNDVLKYAGGTVLTCATLCLGIIRLWT